ncbi:MAG TPA: glycine C-acetyltransferase, partial [Kofleriaceae bacterium]
MYTNAKSVFAATLAEIEQAGLWKHERLITSPQAAHVMTNGKEVINFCANNYLGLSSHPRVLEAAH